MQDQAETMTAGTSPTDEDRAAERYLVDALSRWLVEVALRHGRSLAGGSEPLGEAPAA